MEFLQGGNVQELIDTFSGRGRIRGHRRGCRYGRRYRRIYEDLARIIFV
jgi:hypothetical protein